jgi:hypothetical protein
VLHEFTRAGGRGQLHIYGAVMENRMALAGVSQVKSKAEELRNKALVK